MRRFIQAGLAAYGEQRRDLDDTSQSGLSPYLHFGHVGAHSVLRAVVQAEGTTIANIGDHCPPRGKREGWRGLNSGAEAFLDQLVTWRELGFNRCTHDERHDAYDTLPDWALQTLAEHRGDSREYEYDLDSFDKAATHDEIWNAAQRQLVHEGRIHNYLRMLWGKKILHWSRSPQDALAILLELNNRYALDGRDPNSVSGIFWCIGRSDRAWGPNERSSARPVHVLEEHS